VTVARSVLCLRLHSQIAHAVVVRVAVFVIDIHAVTLMRHPLLDHDCTRLVVRRAFLDVLGFAVVIVVLFCVISSLSQRDHLLLFFGVYFLPEPLTFFDDVLYGFFIVLYGFFIVLRSNTEEPEFR